MGDGIGINDNGTSVFKHIAHGCFPCGNATC
jgi:hypothetical protein